MNKDIEKMVIDNTLDFTEFSNTMFGLLQDHAEKQKTKEGTLITSKEKQAVSIIPIETLINTINDQNGNKEIELSPQLGEFYLRLIGRAHDIAIELDWQNDTLLRKFVKTCHARFPNLNPGFYN